MSNDTTMTIRGFVGSIPNLRQAASGVFVTSFRVGTTPSRRTKSGEWVDEETMWFTVTVFRDLAKRVSSSVRKGMPVLVRGNLTHGSRWSGSGLPGHHSRHGCGGSQSRAVHVVS